MLHAQEMELSDERQIGHARAGGRLEKAAANGHRETP
jgi:hypothetical protein